MLDAQGALVPGCTALRGPKQQAQQQAARQAARGGDDEGGPGDGALRAMPPVLMVRGSASV